jgi:hypothetical protein
MFGFLFAGPLELAAVGLAMFAEIDALSTCCPTIFAGPVAAPGPPGTAWPAAQSARSAACCSAAG